MAGAATKQTMARDFGLRCQQTARSPSRPPAPCAAELSQFFMIRRQWWRAPLPINMWITAALCSFTVVSINKSVCSLRLFLTTPRVNCWMCGMLLHFKRSHRTHLCHHTHHTLSVDFTRKILKKKHWWLSIEMKIIWIYIKLVGVDVQGVI